MQAAAKARKAPFGVTAATLRVLKCAGLVRRSISDDRGYTFQELLLLRTVGALRASGLSPRAINRALRNLSRWVDAAAASSRISLDASSRVIHVRHGRSAWDPGSGQYALPLERDELAANIVSILNSENMMKKKHDTAHHHYLRGTTLEDEDLQAARAAYESCLAGDCSHLEARINLGRLLHIEGRLREAEAIYNAHDEPSAVLYFNLGVLLEDLQRELDAVEAYRKAIMHDPGMADAHFNLSLLHERLGDAQASFRHLLAYRRLVEAHESTRGGSIDRQ
jgi:tetratricopeptide (TPR) repeat protein